MPNINKHVDYIFDEILTYTDIQDPQIKNKIQTAEPSQDQKQLFKSFKKSQKFQVLPGIFIGEFYTPHTRYVVVNIASVVDERKEEFGEDSVIDLHLDEPSEAEFLFCAREFGLKINSQFSTKVIIDEVLYQQEDKDYSGHNIGELINYFERFSVCQIDKSHAFHDVDLKALAYLTTTKFKQLIPLPFEDALGEYTNFIWKYWKTGPIDNVFLSLTSTHWKHSFLELYRCFEGLFVLPAAMHLKRSIGYKGKAIELAEKCVDSLDWRRKEEVSLARLLDKCCEEKYFYDKIKDIKYFEELEEKKPENVARKLYKLRNVNVHQATEKSLLVEDSEWLEVIAWMLLGVEILYNRYREEI